MKLDGSFRFCNAFRKLNSLSKFNVYPMLDKLIDKLSSARYLTMSEKRLLAGTFTESDKEKTAIYTLEGPF